MPFWRAVLGYQYRQAEARIAAALAAGGRGGRSAFQDIAAPPAEPG
jgi:hypothetical protein